MRRLLALGLALAGAAGTVAGLDLPAFTEGLEVGRARVWPALDGLAFTFSSRRTSWFEASPHREWLRLASGEIRGFPRLEVRPGLPGTLLATLVPGRRGSWQGAGVRLQALGRGDCLVLRRTLPLETPGPAAYVHVFAFTEGYLIRDARGVTLSPRGEGGSGAERAPAPLLILDSTTGDGWTWGTAGEEIEVEAAARLLRRHDARLEARGGHLTVEDELCPAAGLAGR